MRKKTKILWLNIESFMGGAERSLVDLVASLPPETHESRVVLFGGGPLAGKFAELRVPVQYVPLAAAGRKFSRRGKFSIPGVIAAGLAILVAGLRVAQIARKFDADVIYSNSLKTDLMTVPARLLTRAGIVWHVRDIFPDRRQAARFTRLARFVADKIVCNSRATKEQFVTAGAAPDSYVTIPNAIDPAPFVNAPSQAAARKKLGIDPAVFMILQVGMLCPLKGQHLLLASAAQLCAGGVAFKIFFAGGEPYRTSSDGHANYLAELKECAARLGVADATIFGGERNDVPDLIAACDVVVLPSAYPESFGRVLLEGMAGARPVIAFAHGGPVDVIDHEKDGFLVPVGDITALAEALERLTSDRAFAVRMGAAGQSKVLAKYTYPALARNLRALLETLDAGKRRP